MNKLLLFIFCFLVLSSCRKDKPDFPEEPAGNYQPVTKNSYWTYRYTDSNGEEDIFTHMLTGVLDTINDKKYFEASIRYGADASDQKAYYSVDKNVYSLIAENLTWGVDLEGECEYFHADAALNSTWQKETSENLGGITFSTRLKGTLKERISSYKIGDVVFKDVVLSRVELQYGVSNDYVTTSSTDYYIAKDIGIIKAVTNHSQTGETITTELIDYSIR